MEDPTPCFSGGRQLEATTGGSEVTEAVTLPMVATAIRRRAAVPFSFRTHGQGLVSLIREGEDGHDLDLVSPPPHLHQSMYNSADACTIVQTAVIFLSH